MSGKDRFGEIDALRGLAVIAMVLYHLFFDLSAFGLMDISLTSLPMELVETITPPIFFGIVGISLYISFQRSKNEVERASLSRKYLIRGGKLLVLGLVITGVTFFMFPEFVVVFGALHFIGVSVVLGYFLLRALEGTRPGIRLGGYGIVAVVSFGLPVVIGVESPKFPFLIPLGITPEGFQSLDYYPVIPWFGYVASGLGLGELFYPSGSRRFDGLSFRSRILGFIGRNALIIYFLHQPLLYFGVLTFRRLISGTWSVGMF